MRVLFDYPELQEQLGRIPEGLRSVLEDFAKWSEAQGFPPPFIISIARTPSQNKQVGGATNSLHLDARAVDLRNIGPGPEPYYTLKQRLACEAFFRSRCPKWLFELIVSNHGTGPHWHIGMRRTKPKEGGVA